MPLGTAVATTSFDSADLVGRCLAGDDAARAEFINLYDGILQRAIARRLDRYRPRGAFRSEADDIRHDVYEKLFANRCRALGALRNARSLDAWLVTVAQNQTVSYMRKRLALEQTADDWAIEESAAYGEGPDREAMRNEAQHRVRASLDRLEPNDRLVLQMYYLHGLKYAEISGLTGLNINTVASRLMRAKEKLRDYLGEERP